MSEVNLSGDPAQLIKEKTCDALTAAELVESGEMVWIPSSHQPPSVLAALAARGEELRKVKVRSVVIPDMGWFREEAAESWNLQVQYALAPDNRQALDRRLIDFHPFSLINQHKSHDHRPEESGPLDVLMAVVTPPDDHGWMCVGNAVWDAVSSARRARKVIVETSPELPQTFGDTRIHVSQVDAIVPGDRPRLGSPDPEPESFPATDRAIAAHVRSLVRDRDTIQVGIGRHTGALPLLGAFDDANDLGFFSELTVPGTIDLVRRGIITSKYAELHPKRFVSCHAGNSLEDLAYVENNPFFELHSYEHTNDPMQIAQHDQMLTLNGALMVDLSGQVGVYALGPRVYSGLGGQLAFHLGAFMSKRGRAVTVLPSSARSGEVSTIVPQFEAGQIVSIPRELADTVVTEHGVARLLGKSVRERAEALIQVADPDHREVLAEEARRLYWP